MLKCFFNYGSEDPESNELVVYSIEQIENIDYRAELVGSSAAPYQLPRLVVTLTLRYDSDDEYSSTYYYFKNHAKKGHKVRLIETGAAPDPEYPERGYPIDKEFFFLLESFSFSKEDQLVIVVLSNLDIDSGAVVQYGGKLTPLILNDAALKEFGLKNIYRLPIDLDSRQNMICVSTPEDSLLALAWAFDNKRHNIGFAPASGVSVTGKMVLIPLPGDVLDGVPKYCIEPDYIIDKEIEDPEVIVTDLNTGALEAGNLVPVVSPVSVVSLATKKLNEAFKIYTTDGELNAWAIDSGLSEDYYTKDSIVLGGKVEVPHFSARNIIAIVPGNYKQDEYNFKKSGWWVLTASGSYLDVNFITADKKSSYSTTGRLVGIQVPLSFSPNQFERARGSFDEVTIDPENGTTMILAPMIGSQNTYSSDVPFAIVKTVNAEGVPTFEGVSGGDDFENAYWKMYPIKAYCGGTSSQPKAIVLVVGKDYSLTSGRIWQFSKTGNFELTYPITGVAVPCSAVSDWSTATYIDWGVRKDGVEGAYCVYTIPSVNSGKTIVCYQKFSTTNSVPSVASAKYYIEVENLLGVYSSDKNNSLIVVTDKGWTSYDPTTVVGLWFKSLSTGVSDAWKNINEMYNGKGNSFVLSAPTSSAGTTLTRTVYIMQGKNPFQLYSLASRKVPHNLVAEVNENSRDISYVIDLPALSDGNSIPLLGTKTTVSVTNFKWKLNESDDWTEEDVLKLATPLLGTLCKYKLTPADTYKVGIVSKVHMIWDGLTRLSITLVDVDSPSDIY